MKVYLVVVLIVSTISVSISQNVVDLGQVCTSDVIDFIELNPLAVGHEVWWGGYGIDTIVRTIGDGTSRSDFYADGAEYQYGTFAITDGMWLKLVGTSVGYDGISSPGGSNCTEHPLVNLTVTTALPVIWSKQTSATVLEDDVIVTFSTGQEINNSHFEIEHSPEGVTYNYIGRIYGVGNTLTETNYEFRHSVPKSRTNYYRVKQVDHDGKYSYSNVTFLIKESRDVLIYPNPVTDNLMVQVPYSNKLTIHDNLGKVVFFRKIKEGENKLDISNLQRGVYSLSFGERVRKKIIKN